jgi:uncharacterized membrane protein
MELLISGLLIWSVVHLIPSVTPSLKNKWVGALGEKGYKLSFTALLLLSLALIIFGWRSSEPSFLYQIPAGARHPVLLLVLVAFVLFGASNYPTRIKNFIRHPQLTGVMVWATAHLLLNGDSRSVLLFGWLDIWALLEIVFISRREGEWVKKPVPGWSREIRGLAISLVVFAVVVMIHPYIAGVPIR